MSTLIRAKKLTGVQIPKDRRKAHLTSTIFVSRMTEIYLATRPGRLHHSRC